MEPKLSSTLQILSSIQDDVAPSLVVNYIVPVFAIKGEGNKTYYKHLNADLDLKPHITRDNDADLVSSIHKEQTDLVDIIYGGTSVPANASIV